MMLNDYDMAVLMLYSNMENTETRLSPKYMIIVVCCYLVYI